MQRLSLSDSTIEDWNYNSNQNAFSILKIKNVESLKTVLVMEENLIFMIDATVSVVRQLVRDLQNQFSTAGLTGNGTFSPLVSSSHHISPRKLPWSWFGGIFWGEHRAESGRKIAALTSLLACTSDNWSASASATSCSHSWLPDSCRPVSLFLCLWCRAPSSVEDPPGWTSLNSPSFPSCREMSEGVWRSCLSCEWLSCHRVCSCGAHTIRSIPINHTTHALSQKKNCRNIVHLFCK